jgi:hypothetical protein
MDLYAVFKTGIYRHECAGIFSSLGLAKQAAEHSICGEPDDYHTYDVVLFKLDVKTIQNPLATLPGVPDWRNFGGSLIENKPILKYRRAVVDNQQVITVYKNPDEMNEVVETIAVATANSFQPRRPDGDAKPPL